MTPRWLTSLPSVDGGKIPVEKEDSGLNIGAVDNSIPRFIWHTTETSVIPGYSPGVRPTFTVGPRTVGGRIVLVQHIPLGLAASALRNASGGVETNRAVIIQVEQVAFTTRALWLPDEAMVEIMASLAELVQKDYGVPEVYDYDPKDVATGTWATTSNPWRNSNKWMRPGHHGHIAVRESNSHWDPGGEQVAVILGKEPKPKLVNAFQVVSVWHNAEGDHQTKELSPHFSDLAEARDWFVAGGKDEVRFKVWDELRDEHKIKIAKRRVDPSVVK